MYMLTAILMIHLCQSNLLQIGPSKHPRHKKEGLVAIEIDCTTFNRYTYCDNCIIIYEYRWESIGEKMLSTFLHSSWERGRVSLIFQIELVSDVN